MNPQQLLDLIIKPTLQCMGGNYDSPEARYLLLCTAAIESDCGYYIKQINGPALGVWQMEPATHEDIWQNCDALNHGKLEQKIYDICGRCTDRALAQSPMYACAMARLKYAMDPKSLPVYTGRPELDVPAFYEIYKRVYNTALGASTLDKWCEAIDKHNIETVDL